MSKDILKVWRKDGFRLTLYYKGTDRLDYRFCDQGRVIFEDGGYRPSPMYAIDSLQSMYGLLGFLSLQPGDTDREYFDKYTPDQLTWSKSGRAEYLSILVNDFEEGRRKRA